MHRISMVLVATVVLLANRAEAQTNSFTAWQKRVVGATIRIQSLTDQGYVTKGSGVVTGINGRKYIMTAFHVVKGQPQIRVMGSDDSWYATPRNLEGWHFAYDLASMQLPQNMQHLPTLPLSARYAPAETTIWTCGYPEGQFRFSGGLIIQPLTKVGGMPKVSFYADRLTGGISGGLLTNYKGELLGIVTHGKNMPGRYDFINFATPSPVIRALITRAIKTGHWR